MVETFVKGLKNKKVRVKMIGKQVVETIKFEDAVKKASKMLRYNSNKPNADKIPKQDERTVAPVFSITIDKETCERIVSTEEITSMRIGNQESTANVHNMITNNNNGVEGLQCFKCGNYGHKAVDCNNKLTCFACSRMGHLSKDCDTPKCTICGKYGHSNSTCWEAHSELRRGRGEGRGRGEEVEEKEVEETAEAVEMSLLRRCSKLTEGQQSLQEQ